MQTAGEKRQAAVSQAEAIIDAGVQNFVHWLEQRAAVPLIQALQTQADTWRQGELIRARKVLAKGGSVEEALDALARGLTQKMLHGALAELHNADLAQRAQMSDAVSRLFLRGDLRVDRGAGRANNHAATTAAAPLADQVGHPVDAAGLAPDAERRRA